MGTPDGIVLEAILNKVTTTVDGGWRLSFDVPEQDAQAVMQVSQLRNETLRIVIITSDALANKTS